jgi:pilus assembly protein CpaB
VNVIVSMLLAELDPDFQSRLPNTAGIAIAPGVQPPEGPDYLTVRIEGGGEAGTLVGKAEVVPGLGQTIYSLPSEQQRSRLVSQYLLQDVMVLKMGDFPYEGLPEPTPTPAAGEQPPAEEGAAEQAVVEPPPPPEVVTLIVTPQDAITLNYLLYYQRYLGAQMTLALRSAEDNTRVQTEAVTLQYLLETYNIPVPAKLPYGIEPRVDTVELPGATNSGQLQPQQ